jgi:hypothetical protein
MIASFLFLKLSGILPKRFKVEDSGASEVHDHKIDQFFILDSKDANSQSAASAIDELSDSTDE